MYTIPDVEMSIMTLTDRGLVETVVNRIAWLLARVRSAPPVDANQFDPDGMDLRLKIIRKFKKADDKGLDSVRLEDAEFKEVKFIAMQNWRTPCEDANKHLLHWFKDAKADVDDDEDEDEAPTPEAPAEQDSKNGDPKKGKGK